MSPGPKLSPEMLERAEFARRFFLPCREEPDDTEPDPDYGLFDDEVWG